MMLTLVNNERQLRQDLRMIIRPLSDEFIHGSPESLSEDCYRMEACACVMPYVLPEGLEMGGRLV